MSNGPTPEQLADAEDKIAFVMTELGTAIIFGQRSAVLKKAAHERFDRLVERGIIVKKEAPEDAFPLIDRALNHLYLAAKAANDQYMLDQVTKLMGD